MKVGKVLILSGQFKDKKGIIIENYGNLEEGFSHLVKVGEFQTCLVDEKDLQTINQAELAEL